MTDPTTFQSWLDAYGAAWEAGDAQALARLFARTSNYHLRPFEAPVQGRDAIIAAIEDEMKRQTDVLARAEIIAADGRVGWAHWSRGFIRVGTQYPVRVEGVLCAEFDESGVCARFRQWWHSLEPDQIDEIRAVDA